MSGDTLYWLLRRALDVTVWGGQLIGDVTQLPPDGAVFVANHAGSIGPIAVAASLPVRLHPWVIGDMLEREKAGAYLSRDFLKAELHLPDRLAAPIAAAMSRLTVWLLRRIGCIPVGHDRELLETYRISDEYLAAGRSLLVLPEDPGLPIDRRTGMRPFKTGFAHLGTLHFARTHRSLTFYPLAVHRASRRVQLGEPIMYNPQNAEARERRRVAQVLESVTAGMLAGTLDWVGAGMRQPH